MKILLIGEFSGFHKNLNEGLIALGFESVVAGKKDGSKKIQVDIDLDSKFTGLIGKVDRVVKSICFAFSVKNYDVVQFINPFVFPKGFGVNKFLIRLIIKRNKRVFLSSCGDDPYFIEVGSKKLQYSPIKDTLKYDLKLQKHPESGCKNLIWNQEVVSLVDGVIPVMYEYALGYSGSGNVRECIPLPINCSKISFSDNNVNNKLIVFHGLNRYGFKGTRHVEKAFAYLKKKYPNDLECIISGGMDLLSYLEVMKKTNVVVDQTYSYSCGMNALYAMAMGKVVLGGAEPESIKAYNITDSPVINIKPNWLDIVNKIEKLLDKKSDVSVLGKESRVFVEKNHECSVVAQKYVNEWFKY